MNINDLGKEQGKADKDMMKGQNKAGQPESGKALESGKTAGEGKAPKKKVIAVYRPQNSQQIKSRPAGQKSKSADNKVALGQKTEKTAPQKAPEKLGVLKAAEKALAAKDAAQKAKEAQRAAEKTPQKTPETAVPGQKVQAASALAQKVTVSESSAQEKAAPAQSSVKLQPEVKAQVQEKAAETVKEPAKEAQAPAAGREAQPRETQKSTSSAANRDGQAKNSQSRDGQGSRDGQRGTGSTNRDGQTRDGQGSRGYGNRDGQGRDGQRSGGSSGRDGQRSGGYGSRDGQGRDGQRSGGFGNRDGQGRDGQRSGGYGSRDGQGRDGQRSGGFGNRDGQGRDGQRSGGYGNRDGQGRDGQRSGGYGNRDGQRGGYGNRDGQRSGGFGNRDGQGRDHQGGRSGDRRSQGSKSAFDSPIQTKPTSGRQNKNAYKNDKYDKRKHEEEEGRLKGGKPAKGAFIMPQKPAKEKEEAVKVITLPDAITIKELAEKMKVQPSVIVGKLFKEKGQMVTVNQEVDYDQAEEIAMEFDILCEKEEKIDVIAELLKEAEENEDDMVTRPPVVCVMGHVDHGKTSLLDAIRKTNVTAKEAGGITQHIGAYVVEINNQKITFLDTPGHEAFTAMRMRGAQSTDIAILVVAADDGVMPQTVEAINHAKAAGVEIIVAVNKIDKPSANVDRVKQEMSEYELVPEDWGGSTIFVPVSAHTQEGIKDLLEMILLTAEVKELKANPDRKARGLVIEAELDKGKGPVATILVQKGTLHVGDNVAVGACYGKVRAMMDDKGRRVKEAGPSTPVEILGLNDVPNAGEIFVETENEKESRAFAETFIAEEKNRLIDDTKAKLSLDALFSQIKAGNIKELPIIIKADVQGSVEAVKQSLVKLSNEEVMVKVIHGGVGAINESDVTLASASNAIIIGFNVRPDVMAKSMAEQEKVDVRLYKVIYQAIEDVEAAMRGMLDPIFEEKIIGHAVVRQTFKASGVGTIAGSYVLDGQLTRGCSARITRDGVQIFDGPLASLKRFKDDVKEVKANYECGLVFEKFNDLQEDDMIEAYAMVEVPR